MTNFDPAEFYYLAQKIYENSDKNDEASARTCINRAYYSAFLTAREKGKIKGDGAGTHTNTINHFKKLKPAATGNRLSDLFIKRKEADYDLGKKITSKDSGYSLKLSKAIFEALGTKLDS